MARSVELLLKASSAVSVLPESVHLLCVQECTFYRASTQPCLFSSLENVTAVLGGFNTLLMPDTHLIYPLQAPVFYIVKADTSGLR